MSAKIKVDEKRRLARHEAAGFLREIADRLEHQHEVRLQRDGMQAKARVPDEVELEVELEIEIEAGLERNELEIEIKW